MGEGIGDIDIRPIAGAVLVGICAAAYMAYDRNQPNKPVKEDYRTETEKRYGIRTSFTSRQFPSLDITPAERRTTKGFQKIAQAQANMAYIKTRQIARRGYSRDLHKVTASGVQLKFLYKLRSWKKHHVLTYFRQEKIDKTCTDPYNRKIMRFGGIFAHVYYDDKGNYVGRYSISDQVCRKYRL